MKNVFIGLVCVVSGLMMACGGAPAPEGGDSVASDHTVVEGKGAETNGVSTEAIAKDPCTPICTDYNDPYFAENCNCCRRHLKHPTCYQ